MNSTALQELPVTYFLLIQGDSIVDCALRPNSLAYDLIDDTDDFQVVIGYVNEVGEREIVGTVAEAHPLVGAKRWCVSSELDGYNRIVGITHTMGEFIQERLRVYWGKDRFCDLCQLPQLVVIMGME